MTAIPTVTISLFSGTRFRRPVIAAAAALAGGVMFALAHHAMLDDSMITLSYARTPAEHGQWGMVAGLPSNSATSVLNVLLLVAIVAVIGHPVVAVGILLMVTMAAVAWWATFIAEDARLPIRAFPAAIHHDPVGQHDQGEGGQDEPARDPAHGQAVRRGDVTAHRTRRPRRSPRPSRPATTPERR